MFKNEIVLKHMFVKIHSNPIFILFQRMTVTYIRHFRKNILSMRKSDDTEKLSSEPFVIARKNEVINKST